MPMVPTRILGATHAFGQPKEWDEAARGKCGILFVRVDEGVFMSAWQPSPDDLAILNAGGHVVLSVVGGQPPVSLTAYPAMAGEQYFNEWMSNDIPSAPTNPVEIPDRVIK